MNNWTLDQNGINVNQQDGSTIADLRNEFEVVDVKTYENEIVVKLFKTDNLLRGVENNIPLASFLNIGLSGSTKSAIKAEEHRTFEGIYDLTSTSASLYLDDICYAITGENIRLRFFKDKNL